jgi:hypothetical protein
MTFVTQKEGREQCYVITKMKGCDSTTTYMAILRNSQITDNNDDDGDNNNSSNRRRRLL